MKIGILGGTFDPIHVGHLETAVGVKKCLGLDEVMLIVSADPPHKSNSVILPASERYQMVCLAAEGTEGLVPSDMEMNRPGKSYTALTLEELHTKHPDDELWLIVGSDSLQQLADWYHPEEIFALAGIAAVPRKGYEENDAAAAEALRKEFNARVSILPVYPPEVSSTDIRNRFRSGRPVDGLLPEAVETYIYENGLYFSDEIKQLILKVHDCLSGHEKRFRHTMAVVRRAAVLSEHHCVDPNKAMVASIVHDAAKYLPVDELVSLSGESAEYEPVLHALVAYKFLPQKLGIDDPDILKAVYLHSTGDAAMDKLSMVLFLADMTEHTRSFPALDEIREAADEDLEEGMYQATYHTLNYLRSKNAAIHPATVRAYAYYKKIHEGGTKMEDLTRNNAEQLARILYNKKAVDIIGIPVADKTIIAEWFLIASGRSVSQIRALSDDLEEKAAEIGLTPTRKEGYDEARWIVLDYGDILVHLFHPDERKYYSIERLWDTDGAAIHFSDEWEAADKAAQLEKLKEQDQ